VKGTWGHKRRHPRGPCGGLRDWPDGSGPALALASTDLGWRRKSHL